MSKKSKLFTKSYLQEGYWGHTVDDESVNGMLEYYSCPPGYCRCSKVDSVSDACSNVYYYDNDDLQCVCDRQGNSIIIVVYAPAHYFFCMYRFLVWQMQ